MDDRQTEKESEKENRLKNQPGESAATLALIGARDHRLAGMSGWSSP